MKNRTAFFLIALMVISPIVSAIDHCAGMHGTDAVQQTGLSAAASLYNVDESVDHHAMTDTEIDCHDSGDCALHLCSGHAVMQSVTVFNSMVSTDFQLSVTHPLYNSPSYSAIRPPISIL